MPFILDYLLIGAAIGGLLGGGSSALGAENERKAFEKEQQGNVGAAAAMPYGGGSISRTHKNQNPWLAGLAGGLGGAAQGAMGSAILGAITPASTATPGVNGSSPTTTDSFKLMPGADLTKEIAPIGSSNFASPTWGSQLKSAPANTLGMGTSLQIPNYSSWQDMLRSKPLDWEQIREGWRNN